MSGMNIQHQRNKFDQRANDALRDDNPELAYYWNYLRDEFERDLGKGREKSFKDYEPMALEEFDL